MRHLERLLVDLLARLLGDTRRANLEAENARLRAENETLRGRLAARYGRVAV